MPNAQTAALKTTFNPPATPMLLHAAKSPIPDGVFEVQLADIVECDFPGYAPIPLNDFDETEADYGDDVGEVLTDVHTFAADADFTTPQSICFYYITYTPPGGPTQLKGITNLPMPIEINVPFQEVELRVRMMGSGLV